MTQARFELPAVAIDRRGLAIHDRGPAQREAGAVDDHARRAGGVTGRRRRRADAARLADQRGIGAFDDARLAVLVSVVTLGHAAGDAERNACAACGDAGDRHADRRHIRVAAVGARHRRPSVRLRVRGRAATGAADGTGPTAARRHAPTDAVRAAHSAGPAAGDHQHRQQHQRQRHGQRLHQRRGTAFENVDLLSRFHGSPPEPGSWLQAKKKAPAGAAHRARPASVVAPYHATRVAGEARHRSRKTAQKISRLLRRRATAAISLSGPPPIRTTPSPARGNRPLRLFCSCLVPGP